MMLQLKPSRDWKDNEKMLQQQKKKEPNFPIIFKKFDKKRNLNFSNE